MPKEVKVFQTLNYIGSKTNLLNYIGETIEEYLQKKLKDINSFLDPFSGTGVVSYYLLQNGCNNVISNDIQHYAYIVSSIWSTTDINIPKIKEYLIEINKTINEIKDTSKANDTHYIYKNFTPDSSQSRMFFTTLNGYKIDIVRQYIEDLKQKITLNEYNLLLKILLYSAAHISNISSTYGAFLKQFKSNAMKDLELKDNLLNTLVTDNVKHISYNKDIFELLNTNIKSEVCYIDTPYNSRNYSSNYFVLECISKYDNITLRGKTGLRNEDNKQSALFCSKVNAYNSFKELLRELSKVTKYLFISYSSASILSKEQMMKLLSDDWNNIQCKEQIYRKFKSNKNTKTTPVIEYLFCATNKNL